MSRQRNAALKVGGLVILAAVVSVAVFLYTGSQTGILFSAVAIPSALLVGAVVYVRSVVQRSSTTDTEYVRQQSRSIGDRMREAWDTYTSLRDRFPRWEPDRLADEFDHLVGELQDQGIAFDRDDGSYSLVGQPDNLQDLDRLEESIAEFETRRDRAFAEFVDDEREMMRDRLSQLESADLATVGDWPDAEADPDRAPGENVTTLETYRDHADGVVSDAIDEVERLLADANAAEGPVRSRLDDAEQAADRGDYDEAVSAILGAQRELESELSGEFEANRDDVETLIETVQNSLVDDYVSQSLLDDIDDLDREVSDLDSALDVGELEEYERRLRSTCLDMIREMQTDLRDDVETLDAADVPPDYAIHPDAADTDYVDELRSATAPEEFRQGWMAAVGDLSTAIDRTETRAAVADAYDDVADRIRSDLRRTGRVTGDDLPVRQPAEFMELYARKHPDVEFDDSVPALATGGEGETYELTVQTQFETGGPEREVTVEVDGEMTSETQTERTPLIAEMTFDSLPYGEYEVRASSPESEFGDAETTVQIDDDASVELTLPEIGLRERLCDGDESEMRQTLPDVAPTFQNQFADDEYLSTEMSFPISDDSLPCLLALWAEDEGYTTREDGDTVLVFDAEQVRNRLANIIQHNMESGDTMAYETVRNRYLSVPASDTLIRDLVSETDQASAVTLAEQEMTKE